MREFVLRLIVNAVAIFVTAQILPGITLVNDGLGSLLLIALVFGVLNALVKPLLILLTCPFILLTLGLFTCVINGLLLMLTADLSGGRLIVNGIGPAIIGGIVMAIVSMVMESVLKVNPPRQN